MPQRHDNFFPFCIDNSNICWKKGFTEPGKYRSCENVRKIIAFNSKSGVYNRSQLEALDFRKHDFGTIEVTIIWFYNNVLLASQSQTVLRATFCPVFENPWCKGIRYPFSTCIKYYFNSEVVFCWITIETGKVGFEVIFNS